MRAALDPGNPRRVVLSTKLGQADAQRVVELANKAGVGKSEFIRSAVLREIEQRDTGPPE
jgi:Ribbon-helix-helix protein, copG family